MGCTGGASTGADGGADGGDGPGADGGADGGAGSGAGSGADGDDGSGSGWVQTPKPSLLLMSGMLLLRSFADGGVRGEVERG